MEEIQAILKDFFTENQGNKINKWLTSTFEMTLLKKISVLLEQKTKEINELKAQLAAIIAKEGE